MNRILRAAALAAATGLACASAARAADAAAAPSEADKAEIARLKGILEAEHPQFGDVRLPGPDATLHLGRRYYFLGADEAKQVLKEWGNPPSAAEGVLGIIFPAGKTFVTDTWGAVVTFEPSGFVTDKDADKADYDKLITDVQAGEAEDNAEMKKQGFPTSHLIGWAQPPSYDRQRHFLIWARDIKFSNATDDTLNYDLRILGRKGVLSLNLVSAMPKLAQVRADAAELAGDATFNPGSSYGDFKSGDKTAAYGVAGLVAAGLGVAAAQKVGLLALIAVFAKKAIVLILAGFAGVAAWVRRLFGKGKSTGKEATVASARDETDKDAA
jgi:uncharacterized membrane-anchored protein